MHRLHGKTPQLIAALATATMLLSLWGTANLLVRGVLLVLMLLLLGLVLAAALFAGEPLGGAERTLYALVASISVIALTGLVMNSTPWGMDSLAWGALLALVTVAAALLARLRRASPLAKPAPQTLPDGEPLNLAQVSLFSLSAVIITLALTIARSPAPAEGYAGYSLLSIVPASGAAASSWQIRVDSQEFFPTTYSLAVALDDEVVYVSPNFTLAPQGQWQMVVDLPAYGRTQGELEARLYRSDDPGVVYRRVLVREALRSGGISTK